MSGFRSLRSLVCLVGILCTGCTAWHQKPVHSGAGAIYVGGPVRAQLRDGRLLLLADVRIVRDTLIGVLSGPRADTTRVVQRIPSRDIVSIQVRERSPQRDLALTAGLLFVGVLAFTFSLLGGGE